ncbi:MAG: SUMF1/EgtB/PvdO family nonheme iron enzyme [Gammaproteobacteria bacterium]|nr:SUMF1/EgtB/PvdO family nonheme iron enzyme [Gammaproteobacteria bacterium]
MGSNRFTEERPEHTVEAQPFAISQYEITIAEYKRFARATGHPLPQSPGPGEPDYPVVNISWPQAGKIHRVAVAADRLSIPPAKRGGVGIRGLSWP